MNKSTKGVPHGRRSKIFAKMEAAPKSNWAISDIEAVCSQIGLTCQPPTQGSHYKVSSPKLEGILIIPHNRPIKWPYIKSFLALAKAHMAALTDAEHKDG